MTKLTKKFIQKLLKTVANFWEKALCIYIIVKTATKKGPFLATPQPDEAMDQSGTR